MAALEFLFHEEVEPARGLATDRYFLNSFQKGNRPHAGVLRIYTATGDVVSAGRFQRISAESTAPRIWRRLSGGRALPFGDGFLGFSLLLPHRSALVSDDPYHLSPYQVPNRYARGVLTALRTLGLDAFYPGRDLITVNRKAIGMVSFETDEHGALVFEGILAVERDFALLPRLLKSVDPEGLFHGETLSPQSVTSICAETGERVSSREIEKALRMGFQEQFHVEAEVRELSSLEVQAVQAIEAREFGGNWVASRSPRPDLDLAAETPVTLGVFQVSLALEQDRFLREVQFSGDFIANSTGIETLEHELRLCPADWQSIALVADQIYGRPENYVLGIGKLRTIPDTILKALP